MEWANQYHISLKRWVTRIEVAMKWLAVGSGPSAPVELERFRESGIDTDASITCNSGIKLIPQPTFYMAVDQIASAEHAEAARAAQQAGTVLVALKRDAAAMKERQTDHYDLLIEVDSQALPHVGGYGRFRYSGPLMMEVALNHGATDIHLVGFDGYAKDKTNYFDQSERGLTPEQFGHKQANAKFCHDVTEETFGWIAAAWSHCRFVQHGPTTYVVNEPNWTGGVSHGTSRTPIHA